MNIKVHISSFCLSAFKMTKKNVFLFIFFVHFYTIQYCCIVHKLVLYLQTAVGILSKDERKVHINKQTTLLAVTLVNNPSTLKVRYCNPRQHIIKSTEHTDSRCFLYKRNLCERVFQVYVFFFFLPHKLKLMCHVPARLENMTGRLFVPKGACRQQVKDVDCLQPIDTMVHKRQSKIQPFQLLNSFATT